MDILTKTQHIYRRKPTPTFNAITSGDKAFEICADNDDLSMDVGDVLTFQESDAEGNLTGRQVTRKVIYKENIADIRALIAEAEAKEIAKHGVSVLGVAVPEYRLLRSIFGYAITANFAIDIEDPEEGVWDFIEGPVYTPILAAPDLYDTGYLEGLHFRKWPPGRYSVTLLVKLVDVEPGKPLKVDVVDLMVLTLIKDPTEDQRYGGLVFEELEPVAILDGRTVNLDGVRVEPSHPNEVKEILKKYVEAEEAVTAMQGDDLYGIYDPEGTDAPSLEDELPEIQR